MVDEVIGLLFERPLHPEQPRHGHNNEAHVSSDVKSNKGN